MKRSPLTFDCVAKQNTLKACFKRNQCSQKLQQLTNSVVQESLNIKDDALASLHLPSSNYGATPNHLGEGNHCGAHHSFLIYSSMCHNCPQRAQNAVQTAAVGRFTVLVDNTVPEVELVVVYMELSSEGLTGGEKRWSSNTSVC